MTYTISLSRMPGKASLILVGCGGTGGFVAEGLCRLLINQPDIPLLLIDHDRVEPHNLARQKFFPGEVGKFKSQALAERLCRQYGRPIRYSVFPYMHDLEGQNFGAGLHTRVIQGIIISCVDNVAARRDIATTLQMGNWWLDAGNGYSSGQILIGNADGMAYLENSFDPETQEVTALPVPTLQLPALLAPPTQEERDPLDCAEAVQDEEQSPVINQAMATLVLEFIHQLLKGTLSWMGAYLDLEGGTLQTVPADPVVVARMLGVKVDTLIKPAPKNRRR